MRAVSERDDRAAPRISAAEGRQEDVRSARAAPLAPRLAEAERDRRGRRVPILLDVVHRLRLGDPELLTDELIDPKVCLVRHEEIDLIDRELRLGEDLA